MKLKAGMVLERLTTSRCCEVGKHYKVYENSPEVFTIQCKYGDGTPHYLSNGDYMNHFKVVEATPIGDDGRG